MTNPEFSLEFDILYNNIMSLQAPGLNEYEKSVLLTKAQEDLLKNYFTPKGNKYAEGIGDSIKRDTDFSNIIKVELISGSLSSNTFYKNTISYNRPDDLFLPLSYKLRSDQGKELIVKPLKEDELDRLFSKPYKEPFKGYAYKVDNSTSNKVFDIILRWNDIESDYTLYLRYLKKIPPIILKDLNDFEDEIGLEPNTLSINGINTFSESIFKDNNTLCREILDRAVNLSKIHYEGNAESIVQYSTTNE